MHRLQELVRLYRTKVVERECARLLKMGPNTIRAYIRTLAAAGLLEGSPQEPPDVESLRLAVESARPASRPARQCSSVLPWADLISSTPAAPDPRPSLTVRAQAPQAPPNVKRAQRRPG